jgi:hypothetical protein
VRITVITPTRGRPEKAKAVYRTFTETKASDDTKMVFVVDKDDPKFMLYVETGVPIVTYDHEGGGMAAPLNAAIPDLAPQCDIVGFVGDDHRFRSAAWDAKIGEVLAEDPGVAYGNDLIRADIPTQVFITSSIVQALGWMAVPGCKHLYLDNGWRVLGLGIGSYHYVSSVVIEHCHPFFGRGEMDEGYVRVNSGAMYQHDAAAFQRWLDEASESDIAKAKRAIA